MIKWGFKIGVDFTGGSVLEYKFDKKISEKAASSILEAAGYKVTSIQKTGEDTYLFKLAPISQEDKDKITQVLANGIHVKADELRFENVGASFGPELIKKTLYALIISAGAILLWVAYQFRSLKFGISAIVATLHDSLVLLGSFSLLGHFFGAEVDFLFVTAMLTILSFSVHDTIVVYDRIREMRKKVGGSVTQLANMAVTETMVRSLNNSFTIIFMLLALILMGGSTTIWFAVALLIGTVAGTYSSPFVAVSILVTWDELEKKFRK